MSKNWFKPGWFKSGWYKSGLFAGVGVGGPLWTVWTVQSAKRFKRDQEPGSSTEPVITTRLARNDWRSFQICTRANGEVANLDIAVGALSDGLGNVIAAGNLTVYRGNQIEVTTATFQNTAAKDDGEVLEGLGWYPDALIPTVHPVNGDPLAPGATYQALPFTLPANETHTFIVKLFVPEGTVPGDYSGIVTVSADGQDDVEVEINLHVWSWALPDTPAFRTALWQGSADAMHDNKADLYANGWNEDDVDWEDDVAVNVNTVLSDCGIAAQPWKSDDQWRVDFRPEPDNAVGPFAVSEEKVTAMRAYIDSHHLSAVYLQHPHVYGGSFSDPVEQAEPYAAWGAVYKAAIALVDRPDVTWAILLKDEPFNLDESNEVNAWGPTLLAAGLHSMVTHMIATPIPGLTCESMIGAADVWTVPIIQYDHLFKIDDIEDLHVNIAVAARLAAGEEIWLYAALSGNYNTGRRPYWQVDRPPLNYELWPWFARKIGATGLLYWAAGVYWWKVYDKDPPDNDPWTNPETRETTSGVFNSEGSLFYPADEASIGYYGIVPSLRALIVGHGIQDFGYFAVADGIGLSDEVDAIIDDLIDDFSLWNTDADAYETARETLGDAIETAFAVLFDQGHLTGGMMAMAGGLA